MYTHGGSAMRVVIRDVTRNFNMYAYNTRTVYTAAIYIYSLAEPRLLTGREGMVNAIYGCSREMT